jgi:hypothetical protein
MQTNRVPKIRGLSLAIGTGVISTPDRASAAAFEVACKRAAPTLVRSIVSAALLTAAVDAAAYTVTSAADDYSAGTLREVIASAGPGSTVQFDPSLNGQTITLLHGQITVATSLTLQGPGANKLTISGNHASRIFQMYTLGATPLNVTISGLTLSSGSTAGNGGAVYALNANLTVQDSVFGGNSAHFGGAIYSGSSTTTPTLALNSTTLSGNSANSGGAFLSDGLSSANISNSTISGNSATACCGGGYIGHTGSVAINGALFSTNTLSPGGNGGGLALRYIGTPAQIGYSTISGNTTANGNGGGLWIRESDAMIANTRINNNTADNGGGVYLRDSRAIPSAAVTLTRDTLTGNTARAYGGGVDVDRLSTVTIGDSLIGTNHATLAPGIGGGIAVRSLASSAYIHDTTLYANYAYAKGGGIAIPSSGVGNLTTLVSVTLTKNSTNATLGAIGGGIYAMGTPHLDNCIAANNYRGSNLQDLNGTFSISFSAIKTKGTATWSGSNDLPDGTDPALGPLAANGGPTLSQLPNPGSPVLSVGDASVAQSTDQRGLPRKVGGLVDIGAVERQSPEDIIFRDGFGP